MPYLMHAEHDRRPAPRAAAALAIVLSATVVACADQPQPFEPSPALPPNGVGTLIVSAPGGSPFAGIELEIIDSRGRTGLLKFDIHQFAADARATDVVFAHGAGRVVDIPDLADRVGLTLRVSLENVSADATRCDDFAPLMLRIAVDNPDLRDVADNPDLIPELRIRAAQVDLANGDERKHAQCDLAALLTSGAHADALAMALNDLMRNHVASERMRKTTTAAVALLDDAQQRIIAALPAGPERRLLDATFRRLAADLTSDNAARGARGLESARAELDRMAQAARSADADLDALRLTLAAIAAELSVTP